MRGNIVYVARVSVFALQTMNRGLYNDKFTWHPSQSPSFEDSVRSAWKQSLDSLSGYAISFPCAFVILKLYFYRTFLLISF
jgi:hypothetical protein